MALPDPKGTSRVASFRLSAEAHARITEQAAASGLSSRAWLEHAILANQTQIVARPQAHPDLKALIFQINRACNALSQIAHRMHAMSLADLAAPDTLDEAMRRLSDIESLMADALTHARAR